MTEKFSESLVKAILKGELNFSDLDEQTKDDLFRDIMEAIEGKYKPNLVCGVCGEYGIAPIYRITEIRDGKYYRLIKFPKPVVKLICASCIDSFFAHYSQLTFVDLFERWRDS